MKENKIMNKAFQEFFNIPGNIKRTVAFMLATLVTSLVNTRSIVWIQNGFDSFLNHDDTGMKVYFWVIVIGFTLLIPMNYICTKCRRNNYYYTSSNCEDKISSKILSIDYEKFNDIGQSKIFNIIDNSNALSNIGWNIIITIQSIIGMLVICFNLILINPILLIPTIVVYFITFFIVSRQMKSLYKYDDINVKYRREYYDQVGKTVGGYNEIRLNGTELFHKRILKNKRHMLSEVKDDKTSCECSMDGSISTIYAIITIVTFGYCAFMINKDLISITASISLIYYGWRLIDPICDLSMVFVDNSEAISNYKKYREFMDIKETIISGEKELPIFEDSIKFNDVSFNYDDNDDVLNHINLEIKKGEHIGICGESGSGKSSFIKLISRLYDPSSGTIEIDGTDIREYHLGSLRSKMGVISQDIYIFNDTILNNITYGVEDWKMDKVIEACQMANIYEFICKLKDGFYTNVGENGLKLSGGQKQRIVIARIFLMNPDIIILDEATSSLDNESEKIIQDSLNIFKDKTIITVAHRLSTIKNSDRIIVISKGEIVEEGDHIQLMTHFDGLYRKMYTIQQFD